MVRARTVALSNQRVVSGTLGYSGKQENVRNLSKDRKIVEVVKLFALVGRHYIYCLLLFCTTALWQACHAPGSGVIVCLLSTF